MSGLPDHPGSGSAMRLADRLRRGFNKSLDTRFFDEPTKIV
jgi:hypothetical protein